MAKLNAVKPGGDILKMKHTHAANVCRNRVTQASMLQSFNARKERPAVVRVHNNGLGFLINKLNYQGYPKLVSESGVSWFKACNLPRKLVSNPFQQDADLPVCHNFMSDMPKRNR